MYKKINPKKKFAQKKITLKYGTTKKFPKKYLKISLKKNLVQKTTRKNLKKGKKNHKNIF